MLLIWFTKDQGRVKSSICAGFNGRVCQGWLQWFARCSFPRECILWPLKMTYFFSLGVWADQFAFLVLMSSSKFILFLCSCVFRLFGCYACLHTFASYIDRNYRGQYWLRQSAVNCLFILYSLCDMEKCLCSHFLIITEQKRWSTLDGSLA